MVLASLASCTPLRADLQHAVPVMQTMEAHLTCPGRECRVMGDRTIRSADGADNIIVDAAWISDSPSSITLILKPSANGAPGRRHQEMEIVFGGAGISSATVSLHSAPGDDEIVTLIEELTDTYADAATICIPIPMATLLANEPWESMALREVFADTPTLRFVATDLSRLQSSLRTFVTYLPVTAGRIADSGCGERVHD